MTAAHCTDNNSPYSMNVVVGEHSTATNIDKAKIIKVKSVNA
jgi:secreted trypsin-like serine protease